MQINKFVLGHSDHKIVQRAVELALSDGLEFTGLALSYEQIYKFLAGISQGSIRVIIARLIEKGYIASYKRNNRVYVALTAAGIDELKNRFLPPVPLAWDGKWRIVIGRKMQPWLLTGFGVLEKFVWVSPWPLAKKDRTNGLFVVEATRFSSHDPRTLAAFIWHLDSLYARYSEFIRKAEYFGAKKRQGVSITSLMALVVSYEYILKDDPHLPQALLPANWPVKKAEKIFLSLIRMFFSSKKR